MRFLAFNIKAVIFDFDGVFVNSFEVVWEAYNHMCSNMDLPVFQTVNSFRDFYSVNYVANYERLGLRDEQRNEASNLVNDYMKKNYHTAPLFQDMVDTAKKLKQKLGIASSSESEAIKIRLRNTGLLEKIRYIVGCDMVSSIKPNPEPILLCAAGLGMPLNKTAYVGDTVIDIEAGRAAGVKKVIAVPWGYEKNIEKLHAAKPDVVLLRPDALSLVL